jgi:hypothetical protein
MTSTATPTRPEATDHLATTEVSAPPPEHSTRGMWLVRYGIAAIMVLGGIAVLVANPAGVGTDGFAMAAGGGLSVLLLNYMYRLSLSSEMDRLEEEQARRYFDEHGEWPDDPAPKHRRWTLPDGVVTPESEAAAGQAGYPSSAVSNGNDESSSGSASVISNCCSSLTPSRPPSSPM